MKKWIIRGFLALLMLVAVLGVGACVALRVADEPVPEMTVGPEADALAEEMMAAVQVDRWQETGIVSWDFGGRQQHVWDRDRGWAKVSWGKNVVYLDLSTRSGIAEVAGQPVTGDRLKELEEKAWSFWCNDSFWLNPIAKLFDEGTTRGLVEVEDGRGLAIRYDSGGVTPGDTYLWIVGDDGLPTRWEMWTQILPYGGVEATWEDWQTLGSGAKVATRHKTAFFELVLSDVQDMTLDPSQRGTEADPFRPLVTHLESPGT